MVRDMEELLNEVCDEEIKDYLKEALKCYMAGSYRACVIIKDKLNRLQKKAIEPFFKLLCKTIINTDLQIQKSNAIRFLALVAEYTDEEYENLISDFIDKDK